MGNGFVNRNRTVVPLLPGKSSPVVVLPKVLAHPTPRMMTQTAPKRAWVLFADRSSPPKNIFVVIKNAIPFTPVFAECLLIVIQTAGYRSNCLIICQQRGSTGGGHEWC